MVGKISGPAHEWTLFDVTRRFGEVTLPYSEAREFVMAFQYNALTGKGQQRGIIDAHLKKVKSAMESGTYTPSPVAASLSKKHSASLKVEDGKFEVEASSEDPLPQTDGGHRFQAIARIVKELEEKLKKATEQAEKEKLERWLKQALNVPVTVTVYLDGDSQKDFVNLQLGKAVDTAHILSLRVRHNMLGDNYKTAFNVAKELAKNADSPFQGLIRFDSRGILPLPISTLCQKGSSDMATSLVGLAKLGDDYGVDAEKLAGYIVTAFKTIGNKAPELLQTGKVLTPMSEGGKKGQMTMLLGLGLMLTYRVQAQGNDQASQADLSLLVKAAQEALDYEVNGNFSGPVKRQLMREFGKVFLAGLSGEYHEGLPVDLLKLLSPSSFGVAALPKPPKAPKARKKNLPDVDGPIASDEAKNEEDEALNPPQWEDSKGLEGEEVGAGVVAEDAAPWEGGEQEIQG